MIYIFIFADSHKHFASGIWEYTKRLKKNVELRELKPVKWGTPAERISKETQILIEKLKKQSWYKIILAPDGKTLSSKDFFHCIQKQRDLGNDISFFIWGAEWLDYEKLELLADFELSLGQMTLPHGLALTMLLEQIYRAWEIEKGSGYHK